MSGAGGTRMEGRGEDAARSVRVEVTDERVQWGVREGMRKNRRKKWR